MRRYHGWVRLETDCVFLGLDPYQFTAYHVARAYRAPPNSQKEEPLTLKLTNSQMATLCSMSVATWKRVKRELLAMGYFKVANGKLYVLDPPEDLPKLHNHAIEIEQVVAFLREHKGLSRLMSDPAVLRRNGRRQGGRVARGEPGGGSGLAGSPRARGRLALSQGVARPEPLGVSGQIRVDKVDKKVEILRDKSQIPDGPSAVGDPVSQIPQKKKAKEPPDPRVTEVLQAVERQLGYPIAHWAKEAAAVKRGLKMGYTPEEILGCWETMRGFSFWKGQWLPMAKVVENLGAYRKGVLKEWRPQWMDTRV